MNESMSNESSDEEYSDAPNAPEIDAIRATIKSSNISLSLKPLIDAHLNRVLEERKEKSKLISKINRLKQLCELNLLSQTGASNQVNTSNIQSTQNIGSTYSFLSGLSGPPPTTPTASNFVSITSTPFTGVPLKRTITLPNLNTPQILPNISGTPNPVSIKRRNSIASVVALTSTNMNNLTAQDIADITSIVTSNQHSNDNRLRQFNGNPTEAIGWLEEFDCYASSNNWDDTKRRSKIGTFCTGTAKDWYALEIHGSQKDWNDIKKSFYEQFLPVDFERHMKMEFS